MLPSATLAKSALKFRRSKTMVALAVIFGFLIIGFGGLNLLEFKRFD